MHGHDLLLLSGVLVAGFACQWLAWRIKLPSILFLLVVEISLGPLLGWLDPDELFGDLLVPLVSLAVAVILYEGSLTLKISEIRGHGKLVRNLLTLGVLITWIGANPAALFYARALDEAGHRVLVASMNWVEISKARMAGLRVFFGGAVSGYAEGHMNLLGLGILLAMSNRSGVNELACVKFRYEIGRDSVFTVRQDSEQAQKKRA